LNIKVNGEQKNYEEILTVAELLKVEDVSMPDMVTVQLNGEFVDRADFSELKLKDNDEIDFLYFMGGGSIGF
jgi:sulfur carrier protein